VTDLWEKIEREISSLVPGARLVDDRTDTCRIVDFGDDYQVQLILSPLGRVRVDTLCRSWGSLKTGAKGFEKRLARRVKEAHDDAPHSEERLRKVFNKYCD
jgi:hypothetical protein